MLSFLLTHTIFSFMASISFAVICNVPKRSILTGGFVGMIGWLGFILLQENGVGIFRSSLVCSLLLAFVGFIAARIQKVPFTVYYIPGIVPVVPGITFYEAFYQLLIREYRESAFVLLDVAYSAVGLASGLIIADVIYRYTTKPFIKPSKNSRLKNSRLFYWRSSSASFNWCEA
ncbi:threonine/serine exporter family protein [Bacillus sp. JCM 19041]|uniref:threonine/serine exporter family protein n=1 Tax=Bacillus sp. JCM 19041 TaxID=1460637 RepID=UPI0009E93D5E